MNSPAPSPATGPTNVPRGQPITVQLAGRAGQPPVAIRVNPPPPWPNPAWRTVVTTRGCHWLFCWSSGNPVFFIQPAHIPAPHFNDASMQQESVHIWSAITRNEDPHLVWCKDCAPATGVTGEWALWHTEFWHAIRCGQTPEAATQAANNNAVSHARRLEILRNS
jgi:hypothetical protein